VRRGLFRALAEHVRTAQLVYELHGNLTPKLWVHGRVSFIAEPLTVEAAAIPEHEQAKLLRSMQAEHGGKIIGRSDEVWLRIGDDLPRLSGRLADHVDTDPSIRTGLLVAGFDTKHNRAGAVVAHSALLDDGSIRWRLSPIPSPHLERATSVLALATEMPSDGSSKDRADEIGWHAAWI
jgi:hypothetical protein